MNLSLLSDRMKRRLTRRHGFKLALSAFSTRLLRGEATLQAAQSLTENIPIRSPYALTGSQFAESVSSMDRHEREYAILNQLVEGNMPALLRKLVPLRLSYRASGGKFVSATIFVTPEYLAIGSDNDFLRIPMNLHTAAAAAERFSFLLPTKKIVDAIYNQSVCRFTPQPLPAGPQMTSTEYYRRHNTMIQTQSQTRGFRVGELVAGHKKDVVLTNLLRYRPGRIAIYGWHRGTGDPIQPLSTVHGAGYADYSHGIRLVGGMALIDGRFRPMREILEDPVLARVLSDEGPIRVSLALSGA